MTQLSTPTTTLIRIPFSGLTDFQPQALAPGLPMLDVNKLTYQILLGWFGDLLAEPELDDEGVVFHAQRSGIRQTIVERALATSEDLHGSLQPQYEKLKNALFDVRPVSPSERLIFNRLQPPIGNHEGFLYRVLTESGDEQLVWCWGFQRRTQYGDARLCSNIECSMLFLHDSLAEPLCPHCGTSFSAAIENARSTSSKFPIGKASAAAAVLLLAGGTFWFSSDRTDLSADTITDVAELDLPSPRTNPAPYEEPAISETASTNRNNENEVSPEISATELADADTSVVADNPGFADTTKPPIEAAEPSPTEPPELFVGFNDFPSVDKPATSDDSTPDVEDPSFIEPTLQSAASLPDLPDSFEPFDDSPEKPKNSTESTVEIAKPESSLPIVKADSFPQDKADETPELPDVLSETLVTQSKPDTPAATQETTLDNAATLSENDPPLTSETEPIAKPEIAKPDLPDPGNSIVQDKLVEKVEKPVSEAPAESLSWHSDYLAAYVEASQEKRFLLMLFRENAVGGEPLAPTDSVFDPSLRPMLEQFSRVELPLNAAMPNVSSKNEDSEQDALPNLLLKHRSFRHLGMQPGIAVVDLTDPASPNHARVVSVLPLQENGQFNNADLMLALNLPQGAISQRTLLFAIRSTVPDSSLSMREFSPTLIELAHRNSRYMANSGQVGSFDRENRAQQIEKEFGPQARLKELVFATEAETGIQDAALQAVTSWISNSESFDILDSPARAMGMEMFQNSESGRWFVTCFVVR
ncbi:MAG: hypothetical protein O2945_19825 [Planctomycetota bacterium]|nr:hypothetical protein [Planctomycetota bacterium]